MTFSPNERFHVNVVGDMAGTEFIRRHSGLSTGRLGPLTLTSPPGPSTLAVVRLSRLVRGLLLPLAGITAFAAAAATAASQYDEGPSLAALVASSDVIVVGRIVRTTLVERDNELADISYNLTSRYTAVIATVEVAETIKGDAPAMIKFTYPKRARVSGEPVYDPGQDGVWLLRKSEKRDEYVADETGRYQPRERKEQIKVIFSRSKTGNGGKPEK